MDVNCRKCSLLSKYWKREVFHGYSLVHWFKWLKLLLLEKINKELQRYDVLEFDHYTNELRIIKAHEVVRRTRHYG